MTNLSRLIINICIVLVLFGILIPATKSQQFVPGFEDVPLMRGLNPMPGAALIFDTPGGRIVESRARGILSNSKLDKFYRLTLRPLGWNFVRSGQYWRENEILNIFTTQIGGELEIIFRLTPK